MTIVKQSVSNTFYVARAESLQLNMSDTLLLAHMSSMQEKGSRRCLKSKSGIIVLLNILLNVTLKSLPFGLEI